MEEMREKKRMRWEREEEVGEAVAETERSGGEKQREGGGEREAEEMRKKRRWEK